jgi:hypothetical protein
LRRRIDIRYSLYVYVTENRAFMPLSSPTERKHIHTRQVTCQGFRRADGLWDIEGHITDIKTYPFANDYRGAIQPGDPIHDMWIRLTVDDGFEVKAVEAVTDKSPFAVCPAITPNFQRLVGLRIKSGWTQKVKELLGGVEGCTHLVELLGPVATTAFQTIYPVLSREKEERAKAEAGEKKAGSPAVSPSGHKRPPLLLNTCHAFRSDGEVTRKAWPEHYTGTSRP